MFCGSCGVEIKEGAKFCGNCGWTVPETMPVQKTVVEETPAERCSSCGELLKDGAKFCAGCGKPSQPPAMMPEAQTAAAPPLAAAPPEMAAPVPQPAPAYSPAPVTQAANPVIAQSLPADKNLRVLGLISIVLLSIGPLFHIFGFHIFKFSVNPFIADPYRLEVMMSMSPTYITQLASFILGIIVFSKLKKTVGAAISYVAIVLLGIISLDYIYHLFRYLDYLF